MGKKRLFVTEDMLINGVSLLEDLSGKMFRYERGKKGYSLYVLHDGEFMELTPVPLNRIQLFKLMWNMRLVV